jgi:putative flippase GtrA
VNEVVPEIAVTVPCTVCSAAVAGVVAVVVVVLAADTGITIPPAKAATAANGIPILIRFFLNIFSPFI